jgi:hypothetical protein
VIIAAAFAVTLLIIDHGRSLHGHWKTITFVAGLRRRAVVAPLVLDGPMNATIFGAYLKEFLSSH